MIKILERSHKLAYIAGIFDGEGSIGVSIARPKGARKTNSYRVRMRVSMCDDRAIILLQELFGGKIKTHQPSNPKHKLQYDWMLRSWDARQALKELLPFLVIKKERAEVAIMLIERVSASNVKFSQKKIARTSKGELSIRHSLYEKIFKLNDRTKKNILVSE